MRYKWIDRLPLLARDPFAMLGGDVMVFDHERAVTSATVLRQLLATLTPAQAYANRLVEIEGYSLEEASLRTGQSASLVKVNIHRGLTRLTAMMEERGDVD